MPKPLAYDQNGFLNQCKIYDNSRIRQRCVFRMCWDERRVPKCFPPWLLLGSVWQQLSKMNSLRKGNYEFSDCLKPRKMISFDWLLLLRYRPFALMHTFGTRIKVIPSFGKGTTRVPFRPKPWCVIRDMFPKRNIWHWDTLGPKFCSCSKMAVTRRRKHLKR